MQHTKKYYFVSVLVHMLVIAGVCCYVDLTTSTPLIGENQLHQVTSYLYKGQVSAFSQKQEKQKQLLKPKPEAQLTSAQGLQKSVHSGAAKKISDTLLSEQSSWVPSSSHGDETDSLLALLHTSIQNQQQYPSNALQMDREGRVSVKFTLLKDGMIKDLHMIKSSGTESLDKAALKAVKDASPFEKVSQYLKMPQEFTIDVVFELS